MPSLNSIMIGAIGVLLIAILGLGIVVHIKNLRIVALTSQVDEFKAANAQFKVDADAQNVAIEAFKKAQAARTASAAAAVLAADKNAAVLTKNIISIRAAKPTGDACKDADALFNGYLGSK